MSAERPTLVWKLTTAVEGMMLALKRAGALTPEMEQPLSKLVAEAIVAETRRPPPPPSPPVVSQVGGGPCQSCIELRQDLNDARDQLEKYAESVREHRTWEEERRDVVAYLRRWVAVRPSIAGYFADEFEAGKHEGASHQGEESKPNE